MRMPLCKGAGIVPILSVIQAPHLSSKLCAFPDPTSLDRRARYRCQEDTSAHIFGAPAPPPLPPPNPLLRLLMVLMVLREEVRSREDFVSPSRRVRSTVSRGTDVVSYREKCLLRKSALFSAAA
jgi:hypothetical protein